MPCLFPHGSTTLTVSRGDVLEPGMKLVGEPREYGRDRSVTMPVTVDTPHAFCFGCGWQTSAPPGESTFPLARAHTDAEGHCVRIEPEKKNIWPSKTLSAVAKHAAKSPEREP